MDDLIFLPRYYANDCVIYGTHRLREPTFWAVCDDQQRLQLATGDHNPDSWLPVSAGLVKWSDFEVRGGGPCRRRFIFYISAIAHRSTLLAASKQMNPLYECIAANAGDRDPISGASFLTEAIVRGQPEVAMTLIAGTATVLDYAPHPDLRPVVAAAERGYNDVVMQLITEGANPYVTNSRNEDLLAIAVNRGDRSLLDVVLTRTDLRRMNVAIAVRLAERIGRGDLAKEIREATF